MFPKGKIIEIFSMCDDFSKVFDKTVEQNSITGGEKTKKCKNQRILQHKTFKGLANRGHCSVGWFYGFKLHIICNEMGEIVNFMFTSGNVDDREPLMVDCSILFLSEETDASVRAGI